MSYSRDQWNLKQYENLKCLFLEPHPHSIEVLFISKFSQYINFANTYKYKMNLTRKTTKQNSQGLWKFFCDIEFCYYFIQL